MLANKGLIAGIIFWLGADHKPLCNQPLGVLYGQTLTRQACTALYTDGVSGNGVRVAIGHTIARQGEHLVSYIVVSRPTKNGGDCQMRKAVAQDSVSR